MIECPCCINETEGPICETCGIGLPGDWKEASEIVHTAGPRERMPSGYDAYENMLGDHAASCKCITCLNLKGWIDEESAPYEEVK